MARLGSKMHRQMWRVSTLQLHMLLNSCPLNHPAVSCNLFSVFLSIKTSNWCAILPMHIYNYSSDISRRYTYYPWSNSRLDITIHFHQLKWIPHECYQSMPQCIPMLQILSWFRIHATMHPHECYKCEPLCHESVFELQKRKISHRDFIVHDSVKSLLYRRCMCSKARSWRVQSRCSNKLVHYNLLGDWEVQ
jgi:hypothetical protein